MARHQLITLALASVLISSVQADTVLEKTCKTLLDGSPLAAGLSAVGDACNAGFNLPVGAKVKECKGPDVFKPNPCKTRKHITTPCPEIKYCYRNQCVPGTSYHSCLSKKRIPYPCNENKKCTKSVCVPGTSWNSCASKRGVNYPCPTWRNPGRTCRREVCVPGFKADLCKTRKTVTYTCGITLKTCHREVCVPGMKADLCKTTTRIKYPCGTIPKTCTNSICVPGTDKVETKVPCGINIEYKKTTICNGNNLKDLVKKSKATCSCLTELQDAIEDGALTIIESAKVEAATSTALRTVSDAAQCLVNKGFDVKNNREEVMADLAPNGRKILLKLPEIDTAFYTEAIGAAVLCAFGECSALSRLFQSYFESSDNQLAKQFKSEMRRLFNPIEVLKRDTEAIIEKFSKPREVLKDIKKCVDSKGSGLKKELGTQINSFYRAVRTLDSVTAIVRLGELFDKVIDRVEKMSDFYDSIASGSISELLIRMFSKGSDFFKELQDLISLKDFKNVEKDVKSVKGLLDELQKDEAVFETIAEVEKVLEGYSGEVQSCFAFEEVRQLKDKVDGFLKKFQVNGISFDVGIKSYNRHVDINFDLPCSREQKKCFSVAGYKQCIKYPEIYPCRQEERLALPNHHIPYVNIKLD